MIAQFHQRCAHMAGLTGISYLADQDLAPTSNGDMHLKIRSMAVILRFSGYLQKLNGGDLLQQVQ